MRRQWGARSLAVRKTLDPRLVRVMDRVLHEVADVSLIFGFRDQATQDYLFMTGKSQLAWPHSKHNRDPSLAVDFQPYPMPKRKEKLWASLAYIASAAIQFAASEGVTLRWGGDWNRNGDLTDQKFDDLFHLEIVDDP